MGGSARLVGRRHRDAATPVAIDIGPAAEEGGRRHRSALVQGGAPTPVPAGDPDEDRRDRLGGRSPRNLQRLLGSFSSLIRPLPRKGAPCAG